MIDDYRGLAVFVAVADAGSFSGAGRRLRLSTSVVSHHVAKLEARLGVSLFFRSTRSMSLSPEGQAMLEPARQMVEAGEAALDALTDLKEQPVGALRVSLPAFGFKHDIHQAMWAFSAQHPQVAMSLSCTDKQTDLVADGFDLAIRLGVLPDSSLKCRRFDDFHRILVAAPSYLVGRDLVTIEALRKCEYVSVAMLPNQVTLLKGGETVSFEPEKTRIEVDSVMAAKSAILAGLGIRQMPLSEIADDLQAGSLVRLLPDWSLPVHGVYAVWPDIGPQKKLTRRLIDFLSDWTARNRRSAA